MAVVTSLTEDKIEELMAGWASVGMSQENINALVIQLRDSQAAANARLAELDQVTLVQMREDLAANSVQVSELNEMLPALQTDLEQSQARIDNLTSVDIPALQQGLDNQIVNLIDRPKVYVQPEAPTNPDEEERFLVVGDTWFDSDSDNKQTVWNGVEWSTFGVEISDFSLTVKKFLSSSHMIY